MRYVHYRRSAFTKSLRLTKMTAKNSDADQSGYLPCFVQDRLLP